MFLDSENIEFFVYKKFKKQKMIEKYRKSQQSFKLLKAKAKNAGGGVVLKVAALVKKNQKVY